MNTTQALRMALEIGDLPTPGAADGDAILAATDEGTEKAPGPFALRSCWWRVHGEGDARWRLSAQGRALREVLVALRDAEARAEQPPPVPGGELVWPLVLADLDAEEQRYREEEGDEIAPYLDRLRKDMAARDAAGREKYNMPLTTRNGHDAGRDAYEEALDLVVYSRQRLAETPRNHPRYDRHLRAFLASLDRAVHECCLRYEVTT